ncbi:MAG: DNA polymerase III subunit epsilon [Burkholderiales bacterium]|nr:DNA polymerase III subunit epsilon [Burkholderiales bacterium]
MNSELSSSSGAAGAAEHTVRRTGRPRPSPRARFAVAYAATVLICGGLVAAFVLTLWADLSANERTALASVLAPRMPLIVMLALFALAGLGSAVRWAFLAWPAAAERLSEQVRLMAGVNPALRADPGECGGLGELAGAINDLALAHAAAQQQVRTRVAEAQAHLLEEKNRLAALMSELAHSVLVCNTEGRVLLYNARATRLLDEGGESLIGLGRSVFSILDRSAVLHALGQLSGRLEQGQPDPVAHFVTMRGTQMLRARMAAVADGQGGMAGFVLLLEDISREVQANTARNQALQQLTDGSRAALANLRAAAETLAQYPGMEEAQRRRFFDVIEQEAHALSCQLEQAVAARGEAPQAPWPLQDIQVRDLLMALERALPSGPSVDVHVPAAAQDAWLHADSHGLVQALSFLAVQLAARFAAESIGLEVVREGHGLRLSLCWRGQPLPAEVLHDWELQAVAVAGRRPSLEQVLREHGAEMWTRSSPDGLQRLSLQLPAVEQPEPAAGVPAAAGAAVAARPVFYDFDLFNQPGQSAELDHARLADLAFTVFDTEATGLSPSEGDEIISIGAVRILNGRLLAHECFDRLVRPGRPIRRESQAVHGLTDALLAGEPGIEQVLPAFHRFSEDTVLVAHNAAFDMRLLQLAQERSGVSFEQPVLDTLLLSALVHPGHTDAQHRLEAIAERLGVAVVGRHTALGDALVTADVFLKLIPLLEQRGIRTLGQARQASRHTLYAKLDY